MLHIRLDTGLVAKLDKAAERMAAERPGLKISRADIVRVALLDWLANQESKKVQR